jgi:type I restriction enzyme S subunit
VDYVDSFIFDGLHLLVAEDGENLRSRNTPVAFLADGQFWVNNHAHVLRGNSHGDTRYLAYAVEQLDLSRYLTGSTQPKLTKSALDSVTLDLPHLAEQQAIAEVLGALDDKIAANTALASSADLMLAAEFRARLHRTGSRDKTLAAMANVVLGGTPSRARLDYWINGTIPWLNSGAVNATRIVEPSEFITPEALASSSAKLMPVGATLLAITGATLGQIARLEMSASGNQSIVGVWSDDVDVNTWLYFAIEWRRDDLLARATGAAQQHVSKGDVEQLAVPVPSQSVLKEFAGIATPVLEIAAIAERENRTLAATRDALLPQLMSGKLRVRDAEAAASEAGV